MCKHQYLKFHPFPERNRILLLFSYQRRYTPVPVHGQDGIPPDRAAETSAGTKGREGRYFIMGEVYQLRTKGGFRNVGNEKHLYSKCLQYSASHQPG